MKLFTFYYTFDTLLNIIIFFANLQKKLQNITNFSICEFFVCYFSLINEFEKFFITMLFMYPKKLKMVETKKNFLAEVGSTSLNSLYIKILFRK